MDSPVVLSRLESLEVLLNDAGNIPYSNLLQPLVLPRLERFKLMRGFRYVWPSHLNSVFAFSSLLSSLELTVHVSSVDIERILRDSSSLVRLSLRAGQPFTHSMLGMLSRGELVPKLEYLACMTDSLALLLDMIEDRRKSDSLCSTLNMALVHAKSSEFTQDCRSRVDRLIAGGLDMIFFRENYRPW
jgi:hypothetical protein